MLYSTSAEGPTGWLDKACLKSWRKEKKFHDWTWAVLNLQPFDLRCSSRKCAYHNDAYSMIKYNILIIIAFPIACI